MSTHQNILVPYDFTEEAECALNHALGLAAIYHGTVYLNHIVDKKSLARLKSEKRSVFDLESDLEKIAADNSTQYVSVKAIIKEGDIFHDITKTSDSVNANLIIFGTHGVRGMQHIMGAFAMKLVTSAKVPVIIVQRKKIKPEGYKTIVYPVDENPYSKQKAYSVSEFAQEHNAEVLLFPKKNGDQHFQNYTDGNLRYSVKVFQENNVRHQVFENTYTGNFSKLVIEFAKKHNADLIAIITQDSDDHDLGDFFVGSEDVHIVNNDSGIPTLCINAVVSIQVGGLAGVTGS